MKLTALQREIQDTKAMLDELAAEGQSAEGVESLVDNSDLSALLATVFQAGYQARTHEGVSATEMSASFEQGRHAGRKEAAEIAALYQVAEMPTEIAPVLAETPEGQFVTIETARHALNLARVRIDESEVIASHLAPEGTTTPRSTGQPEINRDEIFAHRASFRQG